MPENRGKSQQSENLPRNRVFLFALYNGLFFTLLFGALLFWLGAHKLATIAIVTVAISSLLVPLVHRGYFVVAANAWVFVNALCIFLMAYLIDQTGQMILVEIVVAQLAFAVFVEREDRKWLVLNIGFISLLTFLEIVFPGDLLGPREIGPEISTIYVMPFIGVALLVSTVGILNAFIVQGQKNSERLKEAAENANAANEAKSNFLSAMSHEIRTPMNGVIGIVEILQKQ